MNNDLGKAFSKIDKNKADKINRHASELEKLAGSSDGQHVKAMLETTNLSAAMENGDTEAMRKALTGILGTSEGRRLFEKINDMLK